MSRVSSRLSLDVSLDGLLKLLGHDGTADGGSIFLEIRTGVITNFVEKHLKPLLSTPNIRSAITQITSAALTHAKDNANVIIKENVGDFINYWSGNFQLTDKAKEAIRARVNQLMDEEIRNALREYDPEKVVAKAIADKSDRLEKMAQERFDVSLSTGLGSRIDNHIKGRIAEMFAQGKPNVE